MNRPTEAQAQVLANALENAADGALEILEDDNPGEHDFPVIGDLMGDVDRLREGDWPIHEDSLDRLGDYRDGHWEEEWPGIGAALDALDNYLGGPVDRGGSQLAVGQTVVIGDSEHELFGIAAVEAINSPQAVTLRREDGTRYSETGAILLVIAPGPAGEANLEHWRSECSDPDCEIHHPEVIE